MASIVVYSSSSSSSGDDENDCGSRVAKKIKTDERLPAAKVLLGASRSQTDKEEIYLNNSNLHEERKRSFPHERGNWPTFVYIPIRCTVLENLREKYRDALQGIVDLRPTENLHISLSRTVVLRHHHIDVFVDSLHKQLKNCKSFGVQFHGIKIYTNDDKTRTFVACEVDELFSEPLHNLMRNVNNLMTEFRMPVFYKEASFHVSILWCLGDHFDILCSQLNAKIDSEQNSLTLNINVPKILCGIGNKTFTLQLMK